MRIPIAVLYLLPVAALHIANETPIFTWDIDASSSLYQDWNSCKLNRVCMTTFTLQVDPCACDHVSCAQTYNLWTYGKEGWPESFLFMQFCAQLASMCQMIGLIFNAIGFGWIYINDMEYDMDEVLQREGGVEEDICPDCEDRCPEFPEEKLCCESDNATVMSAFYALSCGFTLYGPVSWLNEDAVPGSIRYGRGAYHHILATVIALLCGWLAFSHRNTTGNTAVGAEEDEYGLELEKDIDSLS